MLLLVRALNRNIVFYLYRTYEGNFGYAKLCHRVCPALSSYSGSQRGNCQGHKTPALALVRTGLQLQTYFYSSLAEVTLFSGKSDKLSVSAMGWDHCGCVCVYVWMCIPFMCAKREK